MLLTQYKSVKLTHILCKFGLAAESKSKRNEIYTHFENMDVP